MKWGTWQSSSCWIWHSTHSNHKCAINSTSRQTRNIDSLLTERSGSHKASSRCQCWGDWDGTSQGTALTSICWGEIVDCLGLWHSNQLTIAESCVDGHSPEAIRRNIYLVVMPLAWSHSLIAQNRQMCASSGGSKWRTNSLISVIPSIRALVT